MRGERGERHRERKTEKAKETIKQNESCNNVSKVQVTKFQLESIQSEG